MNYHQKYIEEQINKIDQKIEESKALFNDPELKELAEKEIQRLEQEKELLLKSTQEQGDQENSEAISGNQAILEIRAAAGGDEAGLFAADLYRMYEKYAVSQKWQIKTLSKNEGGIGNIKEIIASIKGKDVYTKLQYESGVHRVQRVPVTESSGRIHTSTVTVAILPVVQEKDFQINPEDLKIDFYRSGGHGGQNVNKVETAVRITHSPTGVVVACQDERSQLQNRLRAMEILRSKLYAAQKEKEREKIDQDRKKQVGGGDRSEKIRTYNFPQNRVTDHRIKKSWHNLEKILDGELDLILKTLQDTLKA